MSKQCVMRTLTSGPGSGFLFLSLQFWVLGLGVWVCILPLRSRVQCTGSWVPVLRSWVSVPDSFNSLFKMRQKTITNYVRFYKVWQLPQGVTESYYKVWQILLSVAGVTKCDRKLLRIVAGITKCGKKLIQSVTVITKWDVTPVKVLKSYKKNTLLPHRDLVAAFDGLPSN